MSQENVEIVRTLFAHLQSGRGPNPWSFGTPMGCSSTFASLPFQGRTKVTMASDAGAMTSSKRYSKRVDYEVESLTEADEANAVVAKVHLRGRARHTDIEADLPFSITIWLRDGSGSRSEDFTAHDEALGSRRAVGGQCSRRTSSVPQVRSWTLSLEAISIGWSPLWPTLKSSGAPSSQSRRTGGVYRGLEGMRRYVDDLR